MIENAKIGIFFTKANASLKKIKVKILNLNHSSYQNRLTCLYDVFNSGDEVDDRDESDERKPSEPSEKTNIYTFLSNFNNKFQ